MLSSVTIADSYRPAGSVHCHAPRKHVHAREILRGGRHRAAGFLAAPSAPSPRSLIPHRCVPRLVALALSLSRCRRPNHRTTTVHGDSITFSRGYTIAGGSRPKLSLPGSPSGDESTGQTKLRGVPTEAGSRGIALQISEHLLSFFDIHGRSPAEG